MRKSLIASLGLHAAILIAALVVLPSPKMEMKPQNAIQVDIANIGDITKVMNATKDGEKPKDKPAPKKSNSVVKTEPAEQVDKKVVKASHEASAETPPPPKPEPKPEPPKPEPPKPKPEPPKPKPEPPPPDAKALDSLFKDTVKDVPEPKKEAPKPEPKAAEQKPPDKPKKKVAKLNPDEIAAFLNKQDKSTSPEQASTTDGKPAKAAKAMQGADNEMAATIGDAFRQKVQGCWNVPPGARDADINVQIHFVMNPDGTIAGTPEVTNASGDPLFDATARSAVSAMLDCQPYDFLPRDRYDLWKDNTMSFNPNMMTN